LLINTKHIILIISIFTLKALTTYGQEPPVNLKKNDSLSLNEITVNTIEKDTVQVDSIHVKKPKETLSDIVNHSSSKTIRFKPKDKITTLYDKAKLHYQDVDLEAGIIIIDYKNERITAKGIKDSTGYTQKPFFKQGKEESTQDSLIVNYKSEKALIWGLRSEQGDMYTGSKTSKKVNDSTIYVRGIYITTSKKKKPDYHIQVNKAKLIPNKKLVASLSQLFIADVPTPLIIPFAYFPMTKTRTSGVLIPSWGESARQGYYLQNGGYYLAISNYFDMALTGDVYTNGSWGVKANSNYSWRYHFNGNFSFNYNNNINSIRGFNDYGRSSNYNIRWSHSQDRAANPNAKLSASVNLGSSKYYRESLNEYSSNSFLKNNLSSSISYAKRFVGTPFNLSLSATHSQNANTEKIIMSLPSLQLSMDRIYPFAPKEGSAKNALQKISLNYAMSGNYKINTTDDSFLKAEMFNKARATVNHSTSLSTNMKVLKYFSVSPSASYKENWYFDYINRRYDSEEQEMLNDTLKGFKTFRKYSTGVGLSTNVYGTFNFKKGRLKAIRHTIRPSVSYSYSPDFSFFNKEAYNPDTDETEIYSQFEGVGVFSKNATNNLSFTLNNSFEAKIMPKDSTDTKAKKITLLNSLNFSTSYNMTADTMRWSNVRMTASTLLFKKLNVNFNATLDPYAINANGNRIDKFNIMNGGSLLRLAKASITMSYRLSNKTFSRKEDKDDNKQNSLESGIEEQDARNQQQNKTKTEGDKKKKVKLYHANIPWNLNLSYSINYADDKLQNEISSNSLMFSGDIELSPKWNVGFNSSYDFKGKGLGHTRLNFQRDLDSWKMSFSWVPFGHNRTYNFFIGVKSGILSELKYDKRKLPDRKLF